MNNDPAFQMCHRHAQKIERECADLRQNIVMLHALQRLELKPVAVLRDAAKELRYAAELIESVANAAPQPIKEEV